MFTDPNGLEILSPETCRDLIGRHEIGRLAFADGGVITIFPVTYAVIEGHAVIRTSNGSKVAAGVAGRPVALEVDDIDERRHTGWSVLIRGEMELVTDEDHIAQLDEAGLHTWGQPGSQFLRLPLQEVTGRKMHTGIRRTER